MAVHTVYQSNAYRIDFNICVGNRGRGGEENRRRRRGEGKRERERERGEREREREKREQKAFTRHLGTCGCDF